MSAMNSTLVSPGVAEESVLTGIMPILRPASRRLLFVLAKEKS